MNLEATIPSDSNCQLINVIMCSGQDSDFGKTAMKVYSAISPAITHIDVYKIEKMPFGPITVQPIPTN